jgi:hypothetical protein
MRINKEKAIGIIIIGDDFEFIRAVRKPTKDCEIIKEVWFKGKAKHFKNKNSN